MYFYLFIINSIVLTFQTCLRTLPMEHAIEHSLRLAPKQAAQLLKELNTSQPTLSRALARLERQGRILRIGKARATKYAAIRDIPLLRESRTALYEIDSHGQASRIGTLIPVYPNHFAILPDDTGEPSVFPLAPEIYPCLPYYLQAARPEGFLGRLVAQKLADSVRAPADLRFWTEDHVLAYSVLFSEDISGAIIAGEEGIRRFLAPEAASPVTADISVLVREAEKAEAGEPAGSSAGGEQPKFTAFLRTSPEKSYHAIVKFSSDAINPAAERWRDLLISEHFALQTLSDFGFPASASQLVTGMNRVFLVIERFDRVGPRGRRHFFSFGALDDALHGDRRDIRKSALYFRDHNFISAADYDTFMTISLYGDLIGNNDQHYGNTSFTWADGGFRLAPAYDVLPMWYKPGAQGTVRGDLHPLPLFLPEWKKYRDQAFAMAAQFWSELREHKTLSPAFRAIAAANADRLSRLQMES
jgi:DNA-binding Lrp family transcriptional regulator